MDKTRMISNIGVEDCCGSIYQTIEPDIDKMIENLIVKLITNLLTLYEIEKCSSETEK